MVFPAFPDRRAIAAVAVALSLPLSLFGAPSFGQPSGEIVFASAAEGGVYHELAKALAARVQADTPGLRVRVITTVGSRENLELLEQGSADVALAQSDLAYFQHFESGGIVALAPLFPEPLHVVVRSGLGVDRLSGIAEARRRPLRAFLGVPGSGTRSHARAAIDALDPKVAGVIEEAGEIQDLDAAVRALQDCELDLLFHTSAVPASGLRELLDPAARGAGPCGGDLLRLGSGVSARLLSDHPFLTQRQIPAEEYGRDGRATPTVSVQALLLARPSLPGAKVEALLDAVYGVAERHREVAGEEGARGRLTILERLHSDSGLEVDVLPVHSGSRNWHEARLSRWQRWKRDYGDRWLPVGIVVVAFLFMVIVWGRKLSTALWWRSKTLARRIPDLLGVGLVLGLAPSVWFLVGKGLDTTGGEIGRRLSSPLWWMEREMGGLAAGTLAMATTVFGLGTAITWLMARSDRWHGIRRRSVVLVVAVVVLVAGTGFWLAEQAPDAPYLWEIWLLGFGLALIGGITALLWGKPEHHDVRTLSILLLAAGLGLAYLLHGGSRDHRVVNDLLASGVALGTIVLSLCSMAPDLKRLVHVIHQNLFWGLVTWLLAIWLVGSSLMYIVESSHNPSFETLGLSMKAILHYLFSGLERKEPLTGSGNAISIVLLTFGVAVVGFFTAAVIDKLLNAGTLRQKRWWLPNLENHLVIVGWTDRTRRLLTELRQDDVEVDPLVVIATAVPDEVRVREPSIFRKTWLVEGDICDQRTLDRADVKDASAALILREPKVESSDHRTIQCALAVKSVAEGSELRTIGEIEHRANLHRSENAEVDEPIITAELSRQLLVQSVLNPGMSRLYEELFSFGTDSAEVYVGPVPDKLAGSGLRGGSSFDDLVDRLEYRDLTLIGYRTKRGGQDRYCLVPWEVDERAGGGDGGADQVGCSTYPDIGAFKNDRLIFLADRARDLHRGLRPVVRRLRSRVPGLGSSVPSSAGTAGLDREVDEWCGRNLRQLRREGSDFHVLVCGWGDKALKLIGDLQSRIDDVRVTLVAPELAESEIRDEWRAASRRLSSERPVRLQALDFTNPAEIEEWLTENEPPDRAVVLARQGGVEGALAVEETSFAIARNLARIKQREVASEPSTGAWAGLRIVVEVVRADNRKHFERIGGVEVVSVADLAEKLMAQAAMSCEIPRVLNRLLHGSGDGGEGAGERIPDLVIKRVDDRLAESGRTYAEVSQALLRSKHDALLLGYRCRKVCGEGSGPNDLTLVVNPPHERRVMDGVEHWRHHRLERGDALILLRHPGDRSPESAPEDSRSPGTGGAS